MDQSTGQQQTAQTQQTLEAQNSPAVNQKSIPVDYFTRLFSGRINRRNYVIGCLLLSLIPFAYAAMIIFLPLAFAVPTHFAKPIPTMIANNPVASSITGIILIVNIIWIPFFVFSISFAIRRLHDLNKSGLLYLLNFIPVVNFLMGIYILISPGTIGENKYGTQPLARINVKQDILRIL